MQIKPLPQQLLQLMTGTWQRSWNRFGRCCTACRVPKQDVGNNTKMMAQRTSSSAEQDHDADDADHRGDERCRGLGAAAAARQRAVAAADTPRHPVTQCAHDTPMHRALDASLGTCARRWAAAGCGVATALPGVRGVPTRLPRSSGSHTLAGSATPQNQV